MVSCRFGLQLIKQKNGHLQQSPRDYLFSHWEDGQFDIVQGSLLLRSPLHLLHFWSNIHFFEWRHLLIDMVFCD